MENSGYVYQLCCTLHGFQQTGYLCDTVLVADDGQLKAHSAVLAASSPLFKESLQGSAESQQNVICFPGAKLWIVKIALQLAYTGVLVIPKRHTMAGRLSTILGALKDMGLNIDKWTKPISGTDQLIQSDLHEKSSGQETFSSSEAEYFTNNKSRTEDFASNELSEMLAKAREKNGNRKTTSVKCERRRSNIRKQILRDDAQAALLREEAHTVDAESMDHDTRFDSINQSFNGVVPEVSEAETSKYCNTEPNDHTYGLSNSSLPSVEECVNVSSRQINVIVESGDDATQSLAKQDTVRIVNKLKSRNPGLPRMCELCGKLCSGSYYRKHIVSHSGEKPHKCHICNRGFSQRPNLLRHLRLHNGEKGFVCEFCGKAFYQRNDLIAHRLVQHRSKVDFEKESVPFSCKKCNVHFVRYSELYKHIHSGHTTLPKLDLNGIREMSHSQERQVVYSCADCQSEFSDSKGLIAHAKSAHDSGVPFACATCNQRFAQRHQLVYHRNKQHEEKSYICQYCPRQFRFRCQLLDHQLLHGVSDGSKPLFQCETCGKTFPAKALLTRHEYIHTGVKPFQCTLCGKQMRQAIHLRQHMNVHLGRCPHKCHLCDKAYKQRTDLILHCARVHQVQLPKRKRYPQVVMVTDINNANNVASFVESVTQ